MNLKKCKKGSFSLLQSAALSFVVVAILIAMGATILSQVQSTQTSNSLPYNITAYGLTSLSTLGQWMPTIAIVIAAVVVLGFVLIYLSKRETE